MYGFVQTNLGLGCLSDAGTDGANLGKTLRQKLANETITDADLSLLNDAIHRMFLYDIRAGDMTARNFIYGKRTYGGVSGPAECVLVDGFGDIHAVPVRSMARWSNRFGLNDSCERLARNTQLNWHKNTQEFSL
jgi:hypothetical protein